MVLEFSGVARALPAGRLAHPEGQKYEEENEQSLRGKNDCDLRRNEENGTLPHPGL